MATQDTSDIRSIRAAVKVNNVFQQATGHDNDGKPILEWMVDYSPITNPPGLARITRPWSDFMPDERGSDPHSAIGQMSRARYEVIKPYVEAAQRGQEVVVQGTPFGMWAGLDQRRAEILRQHGLRTVEEFVAAPESVMIAICGRMPDARYYKGLAAKFLEASEQQAASAAIAKRDETIETLQSVNDELRSQMDEMQAMLAKLLEQKQSEAEAGERRRGRRPMPRDAEGNIIRDEAGDEAGSEVAA